MASTLFVFITISSLYTAVSTLKAIAAFDSSVAIPNSCGDIFDGAALEEDKFNFCSIKPDNYPHEHVAEYLKTIGLEHNEEPYEDDHIDCGNGIESERERNCCTQIKWETPFVVKSESTLKLVVQTNYFQQRIKTVSCADEGNKCFKDFGLEQWLYKTECRTDWGSTKLAVFNSETKTVEWVSFNFPVSCSCQFRQMTDRFNFDDYSSLAEYK